MPRKPQKNVHRKASEAWMTEYLLYGFYTLPSGKKSILKTLLYGEKDLPAWGDVRDELLPQWIREHPGTRPFAWWEQEAPEPRREGEAELDYLMRHNLLMKTEQKLLKTGKDTGNFPG
jgi:hypothetical protein